MKYEIEIEYGSEFQRSFFEELFEGTMNSYKSFHEERHKKNKFNFIKQ